MNGKIRLGVLGIAGRMGAELSKAVQSGIYGERFELVAAPARGETYEGLLSADLIIEFSSPAAALDLATLIGARGRKIPLLIGSTGWTAAQSEVLEDLAKKMPVLRESNFSLGVYLARVTLKLWAKWPGTEAWKISMREVHHTQKKDAPSGTALTLRDAFQSERPGEMGIQSVREGDVVGLHEIVFESANEKLTLIHEAKARSVFATGALDTAFEWLKGRRKKALPPRLLGLSDLY